MLEIPESYSFARQAADMLSGRTVTDVFNATYPHKFTWYLGDPADYWARLVGKTVRAAEGHGAFIDLLLDDETHIALSDGVNLRYHAPGAEVPPKYQLLIAFDDDSFLVFTVAMYGGIIAFRKHLDNPYYRPAYLRCQVQFVGKGVLGDGTAYPRTRKRCFAGYPLPYAYPPEEKNKRTDRQRARKFVLSDKRDDE